MHDFYQYIIVGLVLVLWILIDSFLINCKNYYFTPSQSLKFTSMEWFLFALVLLPIALPYYLIIRKKYINTCKSECLKSILKCEIDLQDITENTLYCNIESWGDDDSIAIAINDDKNRIMQIKKSISAITPEAYLELDDNEEKEDFLWMLHVYHRKWENEIDEDVCINKNNIRKISAQFVQNITQNNSCKDCDVNSHIYFIRQCDVNGYGVLWKTSNEERIYYDAFFS